MFEIGWSSNSETEVVVCIAGVFVVVASRIRHPCSACFSESSMLCFFVPDPLGAPILRIEKPGLPPAHVTLRVGRSILVPHLHAPEISLAGLQRWTTVCHADRLI